MPTLKNKISRKYHRWKIYMSMNSALAIRIKVEAKWVPRLSARWSAIEAHSQLSRMPFADWERHLGMHICLYSNTFRLEIVHIIPVGYETNLLLSRIPENRRRIIAARCLNEIFIKPNSPSFSKKIHPVNRQNRRFTAVLRNSLSYNDDELC